MRHTHRLGLPRHRRDRTNPLILLPATLRLRLRGLLKTLSVGIQTMQREIEFAFQFLLGAEVFRGPVELFAVCSERTADLFGGHI